MKKRFLILPIIISVLLSCFCFTSFADDEHEHPYTEWTDWDSGSLSSPSQTYVMYMINDWFYCNWASSNFDTNSSEVNGVYTLSYLSDTSYAFQQYGFKYHHYETSNANYNTYSSWRTLTVDTNNSTIGGINYSGSSNCADIPIQYLTLVVNGAVIMYYGEPVEDSNDIDVSVIFNPTLSGEIDRSETLPNGVVTYQDLFNFNVINNSSFGIQWAMAIVEQGSSVDFDILDYAGADSRGADFIQHNDNIKFVYLSSEQVYLDTSMGMWTTATAYSSMHYVGSRSESGINLVRWEMVNLLKNHNYDVVVYAVRNDGDKTSYVSNSLLYSGAVGSPVAFENIEEVYRSTFSIVNPALYNSSSKVGGAIANDNTTDYNEIANTLYSYTEATEDDTITNYGKYDLRTDVRGYSGGSSGSYQNYNSGKFSQLLSLTNGSLGFFTSVLKMFPANVYQVFILGFTAIIIIAIIKKVT